MALGLDGIKEGLKSLESGMKEKVRTSTNQGGLKGSAIQKERAKEWSRSKEGKAVLDVALSVGMVGIDAAYKTADAAEGFVYEAMDKKQELIEIGRKMVDKKSYETGEKALDLVAEMSDFSSAFSDKFSKAMEKTVKSAKKTGEEASSSVLEVVKGAKESSEKYTSKLVKEATASAESFKKELSKEHDVKMSAIEMMLEESGNSVSEVVADISDLANKTTEELKALGLTKIEAYTRKDGSKIPTHFRKRAR